VVVWKLDRTACAFNRCSIFVRSTASCAKATLSKFHHRWASAGYRRCRSTWIKSCSTRGVDEPCPKEHELARVEWTRQSGDDVEAVCTMRLCI
jgi:hypothetical protein